MSSTPELCDQQALRYFSANPNAGAYARDKLVKVLKQTPSCASQPDEVVQQILDQHIPGRPTSGRYLAHQFRQDTPEVRHFKHDAFWRGMLSFGPLLIILVFLLWKLVFRGNKVVLYVGIAILVGWLCVTAVYALMKYGVAGIGYRYSHILNGGQIGQRFGQGQAQMLPQQPNSQQVDF